MITGAIPKWAIFAPVFVPLLMRLNVEPEAVLAAYRVGDSPINAITPLNAYFAMIVTFAQKYQKDAGVGTVIALMLPYVVVLCVVWTAAARGLVPARPALGARLSATDAACPCLVVSSRVRAGELRSRSSCSLLLAAAVAMFVLNRPRMDAVALIMIAALPLTGVITMNEALAGFSDSNVVLIAAAVRDRRGAGAHRRGAAAGRLAGRQGRQQRDPPARPADAGGRRARLGDELDRGGRDLHPGRAAHRPEHRHRRRAG